MSADPEMICGWARVEIPQGVKDKYPNIVFADACRWSDITEFYSPAPVYLWSKDMSMFISDLAALTANSQDDIYMVALKISGAMAHYELSRGEAYYTRTDVCEGFIPKKADNIGEPYSGCPPYEPDGPDMRLRLEHHLERKRVAELPQMPIVELTAEQAERLAMRELNRQKVMDKMFELRAHLKDEALSLNDDPDDNPGEPDSD